MLTHIRFIIQALEESRAAKVEVLVDVNGDRYLAAGSVTRPKHPVLYLNQEADLVRVYCEGNKVLCDLRVVETGQILSHVPHHAIED